MKQLTQKWLEEKYEINGEDCATDLEQYIASLWTTITDDPGSLPEVGREIMMFEDDSETVTTWRTVDVTCWEDGSYYGWRWRYFGKDGGIAGCDYPMEDGDG